MRLLLCLLAVVLAASAAPNPSHVRIIGGSVTTIGQYPIMGAVLYSWNMVTFQQNCAGIILNQRSLLSSAHPFVGANALSFRIRVGSTYANSGGVVYNVAQNIIHLLYNAWTFDNDIAIIRVATAISFNNNVQPAFIAGANYNLADNQVVWTAGWGLTSVGGFPSEQLRHVQIWSVNQAVCRQRYAEVGTNITDNMLCAGWLDVGGRDHCSHDSGGPLHHNNVIVGIVSFGQSCALARYPGVYARVSRYTTWIQANA